MLVILQKYFFSLQISKTTTLNLSMSKRRCLHWRKHLSMWERLPWSILWDRENSNRWGRCSRNPSRGGCPRFTHCYCHTYCNWSIFVLEEKSRIVSFIISFELLLSLYLQGMFEFSFILQHSRFYFSETKVCRWAIVYHSAMARMSNLQVRHLLIQAMENLVKRR